MQTEQVVGGSELRHGAAEALGDATWRAEARRRWLDRYAWCLARGRDLADAARAADAAVERWAMARMDGGAA